MLSRLTPLFVFSLSLLTAEDYRVTPDSGLSQVPETLQAGDTVVLADGVYTDVIEKFHIEGTREKPVKITAENPGRVFFAGKVHFRFEGSWLEFSGFIFDGDEHPGGPGYPSGIVRLGPNSSDCIIRDCRFHRFDEGADPENGSNWLYLAGFRHLVENCSFSQKIAPDPVIVLSPDEDQAFEPGTRAPTQDVPRNHQIRYCYFGERTNIGENGFEIIRMAEGKFINFKMASLVEHCLFERAIYRDSSGEPEIISNKSCGNTYRGNTFRDCRGGIVLRAGDDCVVENNFFFGEPESKLSSGIRVIGQGHLVRNNYLQDIDGTGLNAAICVMKGSGGWSDTKYSAGYETPNGARIYHNTIVNCRESISIGVTSSKKSKSGTVAPEDVIVANNAVLCSREDESALLFNQEDGFSLAQVTWLANHAELAGSIPELLPESGFAVSGPLGLLRDEMMEMYLPSSESVLSSKSAPTDPLTEFDILGRKREGKAVGCYDPLSTGDPLYRPLHRKDVGPNFDRN